MREGFLSYYLILFAIFLGLISPYLLTEGMFVDGITYAVVSRNLATGLGSIWDLHYTGTLFTHFHEHPPLAFALQGLFFSVFGDSLLVERFYSVLTYPVTGLILVLTWRQVVPGTYRSLGWLPLLFWLCVPLVSWAAPNNLLENTMMILTGGTILLILHSYQHHRWLFLSMAGLTLFLGFLTKGFVSLFPLSLPFWMWIFGKSRGPGRFLTDTFVLTLSLFLSFLILFLLFPASKESLQEYVRIQVVGSIQNVSTVSSRFYIVGRLLAELGPGIGIALLTLFLGRRPAETSRDRGWLWILGCLGLSAVLPIMISLKQRGFYILPAFPLFSLVLAGLVAPGVKGWTERIKRRVRISMVLNSVAASLLIFSVLLILKQAGNISRDQEMIEDVRTLKEHLPGGSTLSVARETWYEWALHAYLFRYANISLDRKVPLRSPHLLLEKNSHYPVPEGYLLQPVPMNSFRLYSHDPDACRQ